MKIYINEKEYQIGEKECFSFIELVNMAFPQRQDIAYHRYDVAWTANREGGPLRYLVDDPEMQRHVIKVIDNMYFHVCQESLEVLINEEPIQCIGKKISFEELAEVGYELLEIDVDTGAADELDPYISWVDSQYHIGTLKPNESIDLYDEKGMCREFFVSLIDLMDKELMDEDLPRTFRKAKLKKLKT